MLALVKSFVYPNSLHVIFYINNSFNIYLWAIILQGVLQLDLKLKRFFKGFSLSHLLKGPSLHR